MTDNIITARLFIDMDGTLAAWQQAACFEDLLQENYSGTCLRIRRWWMP